MDKELSYMPLDFMLGNLNMANDTDKERGQVQMEKNTLENIKMVNDTDKGLTHTQMETNTLEILNITNNMNKELLPWQTGLLRKVSGNGVN